VVPRGAQLCFVLLPLNGNAPIAVNFDMIDVPPGGVLEVQTITTYNQKRRTFTGPKSLGLITLDNYKNFVHGGGGEIVMVSLAMPATGTRTRGFVGRAIAPCTCQMFLLRQTCEEAPCNCKWFVLSCGEMPPTEEP